MNSQPTISIIAALSENRVVGLNDRIPWHIKEDLVRFKQKTAGHVMILGRKTFESLIGYYERSDKPLPNRIHIVVTKNKHYSTTIPKTHIVYSLEQAIEMAKKEEKEEIFIAGGAQIFKQSLPYVDKLYLTIVKGSFAGDAFFPDYSEFNKVLFKEDKRADKYAFTFIDLVRTPRANY